MAIALVLGNLFLVQGLVNRASSQEPVSEESVSEESVNEESVNETIAPITREEFFANPLEAEEPDPLLPRFTISRPFSPQELRILRSGIEDLEQEGQAQFQAGNLDQAFALWNRELRLRRILEVEPEITALGRVGEIAWRENKKPEVLFIAERLQQIQAEVQSQSPIDFELLQLIGSAFYQMRARASTVDVYQQLAAEAERQGDTAAYEAALVTIGEVYLIGFDYAEAADTYQILLEFTRANGDRVGEGESLEKLAYIHEQNNQPQPAITFYQQLVDFHQAQQNLTPLPALKLAIANNYQTLGQSDLAATSYKEAYAIAQAEEQFGYASDALRGLASLYRSLERPSDALVVYQVLIVVEQQSYNTFGLMDAYDQIGQIHRSLGANSQALSAFQIGLELARQIQYREGYFANQVEQLTAPDPSTTMPTPEQEEAGDAAANSP
ncbi:MAG: hypothetical protein F6K19_49580 [Cyanothece sp. SIO1E1]|nr:hypothetical protein [Cyanothece sp. SIO1E1]